MIPFGDFDSDVEGQHSGISIPFSSIFNAYKEAQEMETQTEVEVEAQPPAKRVKRIGRTPSPIEELKSEDEAKFRTAEEAAAENAKDSDFEPSDDESSQQS